MIPEYVTTEIVERIKSEWPNDKILQKMLITNEEKAYTELQELDLGELNEIKDELIKSSKQILEKWTDTHKWVILQLDAIIKISNIQTNIIPKKILDEWKLQAKEKFEDNPSEQLKFIKNRIEKYESTLKTQNQLDSVKDLLIELEHIIGNECYNGSIQNYAYWGELESEGRQFRYPVKFYTENGETKRWTVSPNTPSEELITGHYSFGANELNIYRALFKVVMHLKEKYELKI